MNSEMPWDAARIALGQVARFFDEKDSAEQPFTLEELRSLENYDLIPAPVRETLEGLTLPERQLLKRVFNTLNENHFYLENVQGGLWCY